QIDRQDLARDPPCSYPAKIERNTVHGPVIDIKDIDLADRNVQVSHETKSPSICAGRQTRIDLKTGRSITSGPGTSDGWTRWGTDPRAVRGAAGAIGSPNGEIIIGSGRRGDRKAQGTCL